MCALYMVRLYLLYDGRGDYTITATDKLVNLIIASFFSLFWPHWILVDSGIIKPN